MLIESPQPKVQIENNRFSAVRIPTPLLGTSFYKKEDFYGSNSEKKNLAFCKPVKAI